MASTGPLVLVSSAKGERRTLKAGFKQLGKHLRGARCEVQRLDAATGITPDSLSQAAIVVFGCPTRHFTLEELECIKAYVQGGGAVLVLASAGGEAASGSNLNYLLEEFGTAVADDSVVASAFTKYLHPKEVLVDEGALSPDMAAYCAAAQRRTSVGVVADQPSTIIRAAQLGSDGLDQNGRPVVEFVYPHGATVVVQEPAVAILSSGRVAHPYNMAIGAAWWQDGDSTGAQLPSSSRSSSHHSTGGSTGSGSSDGGGRLAVLGSCHMFDDEWLGKEHNTAILDFILGWMLRDPACSLSRRNLEEPEIVDMRPVTHLEELAAQPKVMLEVGAEPICTCLVGWGGQRYWEYLCLPEGDVGSARMAGCNLDMLPLARVQLPPPLPADITTLFSTSLFKLDLSLVPEVGRLHQQLGVPRK